MQNKKVHVLYILTKLELGGAQKVCLSLMEGIKESGSFSGLISGNEGALLSQVKKFDSVYLLRNFKREVGIKTIFNEFKTLFQMVLYLRKSKKKYPDLIIHTHSTKAGIIGRWAAFFARIKTRVHTVHGFGFHDHQNKIAWMICYLLELFTSFVTTHYICVSAYDQNTGKKLLPRFGKKSSIIRAAVEWDKFYIPAVRVKDDFESEEVFNIPEKKFIIGTVSCFKPQKNVFDLLKAFKQVCDKTKKQNLLLQMVGDGILRDKIEEWILQNGMKDKIDLLGWQDDVSMWMRNWNVFVMSSLWEGLPCAVVEARLSKLPVVSYKIAGIPEVIYDNKNGFLVDAGNWQEMADKIQKLFLDEKLWKRIKNYPDDLNDFKDRVMVEKHLNLYRQLSSF